MGILYKFLSFALKKDNDLMFLMSLSKLFQSLKASEINVFSLLLRVK